MSKWMDDRVWIGIVPAGWPDKPAFSPTWNGALDTEHPALDTEHPAFREIASRARRRMERQMYIAMHAEPVVPTHWAPGVRPVRLLTTSRYDWSQNRTW